MSFHGRALSKHAWHWTVSVAMWHYYFDSFDDLMTAFAPHAEALQADIANYTNIEPIIQINDLGIYK
ncbi:MAG: EthD family reductase [Candidatus Thiodiazotropha sp.]